MTGDRRHTREVGSRAQSASREARTLRSVLPEDRGELGTIVILDGDPDVRLMMSRLLQRHSLRTWAAGDAEETLKFLRSGGTEISLLILDLHLLRGTAGRFLKRARKLHPGLSALYLQIWRDGGIDRDPNVPVLLKPFGSAALLSEVFSMLESHPT